MYDATKDSIKKNNKLSKVDWGITLIIISNNIFLDNRILKKNQPLNYFYLQFNKFIIIKKSSRFRLILI